MYMFNKSSINCGVLPNTAQKMKFSKKDLRKKFSKEKHLRKKTSLFVQ